MKRLGDMSRTALVTGAAIVVASAASATAATVITGADIKDGTVTDRDIQNGSLRGPDVQDRSLGSDKLSAKAIASLRGNRGPRGARGVRGARGARGPEGPAPRATYEKQEAKIKPGGVATVKATCPDGFEPSGGGFLDASGRLKIVGSYPISSAADQKPGWIVSVGNPDPAEQTVTAYAVCARGRT